VSDDQKNKVAAKQNRGATALRPVAMAAAATGAWFLMAHHSMALPPASQDSSMKTNLFTLEEQSRVYAAYAGSASCKECHEKTYASWAKSHHGLAERLPDPGVDEAAFDPARTFRHGTQQTLMRKSKGNYELVSAGLNRMQEVFRVERIMGDSPLRQMLVPFPGGRWQATEVCWDPRSNEWFDVFGTEDRQPGEWGHWTGRGMNWNSMCATCHNTRMRKNYLATNDTYRSAMAERGVGCESCHGPMRAHNDWQHANKGSRLADPTLQNLSRDQMFDACATCHARRGEITGDLKPGDSFLDHYIPSMVDESDLFYADGQVREEDYEFAAFLGSRMYHGGVRCWDCHDAHTAKPILPGNMLCLKCHSGSITNAPVINPVTHSHHQVFGFTAGGAMTRFNLADYQPHQIKETGGECVNCHMPQTVYMQRHWRHDHGFTIPDPLLTKEFAIPNACNRCHQDKGVDWSLQYVQQWYGDKMNRPYRQHAQTVARARRGDDAARDDLLKMLQGDAQFYWRATAANILERWALEPQVSAALRQRLADTNALVRQNIVQTLGALGESASPEIRAALQTCLNDSSRNVRVMAAQALAATLETNSLAGSELLHMLEHGADQPAGQMQLGVFQFARADFTNALFHFQTAAGWDPYSPVIRHELAIVLSRLGHTQEALAQLQEAVRLAPNEAEFHFKLGLAWNEIGENAKALAELEEAVRLDPHHARAAYNLGLARDASGDTTGAIQALVNAEKADPRDPRIPYARATIQAQLGHWSQARQAAQRALDLDPQFNKASVLLEQIEGK
jgi:tetratricopeptide (TPR) repeat protein